MSRFMDLMDGDPSLVNAYTLVFTDARDPSLSRTVSLGSVTLDKGKWIDDNPRTDELLWKFLDGSIKEPFSEAAEDRQGEKSDLEDDNDTLVEEDLKKADDTADDDDLALTNALADLSPLTRTKSRRPGPSPPIDGPQHHYFPTTSSTTILVSAAGIDICLTQAPATPPPPPKPKIRSLLRVDARYKGQPDPLELEARALYAQAQAHQESSLQPQQA
ncbi:MAG: hypothetical protein Q9218_008014 [Villophora microphyllina]